MNIDLSNFNGAVVYENGKIIAYMEYTESEKQKKIDKAIEYIKNSDENSIVKHFLIVDHYISITETNSDFNVFCMNMVFII